MDKHFNSYEKVIHRNFMGVNIFRNMKIIFLLMLKYITIHNNFHNCLEALLDVFVLVFALSNGKESLFSL